MWSQCGQICRFQHTAARRRLQERLLIPQTLTQSFNTQPPEGGCKMMMPKMSKNCRFNTQPPEGGCLSFSPGSPDFSEFQHTAARRRLPFVFVVIDGFRFCFNTQPPEGGCRRSQYPPRRIQKFQHTAARRRLRFVIFGACAC